jgi:hypothetical protein
MRSSAGRRATSWSRAAERQVLIGLDGDDRFVLGEPGRATITDFRPGHDTVEFGQAGGQGFADLGVRSRQGHAVVRLDEYRVDLPGVQPDELAPRDFVFA